jgi:hypothetical protein
MGDAARDNRQRDGSCVAKVGIVGIVRPLDARTVANAWSPSSCPEPANVRCGRDLHVLHANG